MRGQIQYAKAKAAGKGDESILCIYLAIIKQPDGYCTIQGDVNEFFKSKERISYIGQMMI